MCYGQRHGGSPDHSHRWCGQCSGEVASEDSGVVFVVVGYAFKSQCEACWLLFHSAARFSVVLLYLKLLMVVHGS